MTPAHHPEADELIEYATGASSEWLSLLVACHLTLCPRCRDEVALLEALGGELLARAPQASGTDPDPTPPDAPAEPSRPGPPPPAPPAGFAATIPRPLHAYFREARPRWRWLAPGARHLPLSLEANGHPVRLVRFRPGFTVPAHSHGGLEMLLVLDGDIDDSAKQARFGRGDVCRTEIGGVHTQRVGADAACTALVVNLGPLEPKTLLGRVLKHVVGV